MRDAARLRQRVHRQRPDGRSACDHRERSIPTPVDAGALVSTCEPPENAPMDASGPGEAARSCYRPTETDGVARSLTMKRTATSSPGLSKGERNITASTMLN